MLMYVEKWTCFVDTTWWSRHDVVECFVRVNLVGENLVVRRKDGGGVVVEHATWGWHAARKWMVTSAQVLVGCQS